MSLLSRIVIFFITCIFIVNTGCHNKVYNQAQGNIADSASRSEQAIKKSDNDAKPQPALVVNPGLYVDKTPINLAKEPSWLKSNIIIRGENLPFSYYSRAIVNGGDQNGQIARIYSDYKGTYKDYKSMAGVPVVLAQPTFPGEHTLTRYQIGLDPTVKFSMNYSGSIKGALDLLAAKSGYVYSVDGNNIYWQAFITKTYDIAFMPGSSDYLMGKATGSSGSSSGSSGGSSGGGSSGGSSASSSSSSTGFLDDSSTAQYSSLKGTLSVWKDLNATIKQLLSPGGRVIISEATTSVTVRDRPSNIELVSNYIENFNKNLSSQVLIKVEVLEVNLSDDFNFGINWQAVQQNIGKGTQFVLNSNSSAPITIASLTAGAANPTIGLQQQNNARDFLAPLITALQQQGRVSVVSEPRVVTLNNQVASVRIVNQQGYLAALQLTSFGTTSSTPNLQNQVTSQVTPGTVITGLTLYILPKIMNKKIYLQVNADLSTLNQLTSISSTGLPSTTLSPQPSIQIPNITQKQFNQRSVIASGDTMVLSGFKQITNRANTQELMNSADLGGRAAQQANTETIVLITPIILYGCA